MIETYILTGPAGSGKTTRAKEITGNRGLAAITTDLSPNPTAEVLVIDEIPTEISLLAAYHWIKTHLYQFPELKTLILITQATLSNRYDKHDHITVEEL